MVEVSPTDTMMNNNAPICDLCKSPRYHVAYKIEKYEILRCGACGLVYRHPMPTDEQLYQMYNSVEETELESVIAYYRDFRRQTYRRMFLTAKLQLETFPSVKVLDLGTGWGWSFEVIKEFGYFPIGIDIDLTLLREASKEGIAIQGWARQVPFASNSLTALLATDVLEHVPDPREVLREVHRVLTQGGLFFIRVPDAAGIITRTMDLSYKFTLGKFNKAGKILYRLHLYGFTRSTLERYLDETGFDVVTYYGENWHNPSQLRHKKWAENPLIRLGINVLTRLGEILDRSDEIVMIVRKR